MLTGGGQQSRYVTKRVDVFSKTALPYQEIFHYDVAERLVLITCGGTFDSATARSIAVRRPVAVGLRRRARTG